MQIKLKVGKMVGGDVKVFIPSKTRVKYTSNSGLPDVSLNITGVLSSSSIPDIYDVEEVVIGNAVTSIDDYAFSGCYGLVNMTIPESVKSIGSYTFNSCDSLNELNMTGYTCDQVLENAPNWNIGLPRGNTVTVWCSDGVVVISPPPPSGSGS